MAPSTDKRPKRKAARKKRSDRRKSVSSGPVSHLLAQKGPDSLRARYIHAMKNGFKLKHAAKYAGCDPSTIRAWEEIAEADFIEGRETMHTAFVIEVRQVQMDRINRHIKTIEKAAKHDWHAARHLLGLEGYVVPKEIALSGSVQTGAFPSDSDDENA